MSEKPRVTLLELTDPHTQAMGVRLLSAVARERGWDRSVVHLCGDHHSPQPGEAMLYESSVVEKVVEIANGSDLVGVSFLTTSFDRAVQLTTALREKLRVPIIWGGFEATARPERSLEHADIVCIGEGDATFGELLDALGQKRDATGIPGLWYKTKDGRLVQNEDRPLEQDLDKFPFQDYDLNDQYFYNKRKGEIVPLTFQDLQLLSEGRYNVMMTRGCPSSCTFCYNSTWQEHYGIKKYVRSRSVENTLAELAQVKAEFPFVKFVMFADDNFFAKPLPMLKEFQARYPEQVGLPFWAQITPLSVDEKKIDLMVDAGLRSISMGIQTANEPISTMYDRPRERNLTLAEISALFHRYWVENRGRGMEPPQYDFILDSYWENPDAVYENLALLLEFPKPFKLHLASLVLYPGTKLYDKANAEGLIRDEHNEIYRRPFMDKNFNAVARSYPNLLIVYFEFIPKFLMRILIRPGVRKVMEKAVPGFALEAGFVSRKVFEKARFLMELLRAGDFRQLGNRVRKAFQLEFNWS